MSLNIERQLSLDGSGTFRRSFFPVSDLLRTTICAGRNVRDGVRVWSTDGQLPIPRTTLAITCALERVFPEKVNEVGRCEVIRIIGSLSPLLVSLNEAADIGISARLRRESGCRQPQFLPLLMLENGLMLDLHRKYEAFSDSNGNGKAKLVADVLINDSLLLSKERRDFSGAAQRSWLELDSGLCEVACQALVFPEVLESAGIDFPGRPCRTVGDLLSKYSLLILGEADGVENMEYSQRRILGLHCAEMLLKVSDDIRGGGVDRLLGLPRFITHAKSVNPTRVKQVLGEVTN